MKKTDRGIIAAGLVAGVIGLAILVVFIGQGSVRQAEIFYPERVVQHVSFQKIGGELAIVATKGVKGVNPTLISRTGFWYVLTVTNDDDLAHRLYIDGLELETEVLLPGESGQVVFLPESEATYRYYDRAGDPVPLGEIRIVTVVPSDEFTGIWRDLI